jgi:ankyrin repeat protein
MAAIVVAAIEGHLDVVELLAKHGASANSTLWSQEENPLFSAARNGTVDGIKFLISQEADIEAASTSHCSPLMIAASNKRVEVVEYLLGQGVCTNAGRKSDNWNALFAAIRQQSLPIVQLLVQHGASVNVATSNGRTPLLCATAESTSNFFEIVQFFAGA